MVNKFEGGSGSFRLHKSNGISRRTVGKLLMALGAVTAAGVGGYMLKNYLEEVDEDNLGFDYDKAEYLAESMSGNEDSKKAVLDYFLKRWKSNYSSPGSLKSIKAAYMRGSNYFLHMQRILKQQVLEQLKYYYKDENFEEHGFPKHILDNLHLLSIVESSWEDMDSPDSAHGPLQIMPDTARKYDLKLFSLTKRKRAVGQPTNIKEVDYYLIDQRRDPILSCNVLVAHILDLEKRGSMYFRNTDIMVRLCIYNGNLVNEYLLHTFNNKTQASFFGYMEYLGNRIQGIRQDVEKNYKSRSRFYSTQKGDSLYSISQKFGVPVNALFSINSKKLPWKSIKGDSQRISEELREGLNLSIPLTYKEFNSRVSNIKQNFEYPIKLHSLIDVINSEGIKGSSALEFDQLYIKSNIKTISHKVDRGDDWRKIAGYHNVPLDLLRLHNPNVTRLIYGQTLKVPTTEKRITLRGLSQELKVDLNELLKLNPSIDRDGSDINLLFIGGFHLYLPVGKTSSFKNLYVEKSNLLKDFKVAEFRNNIS